MKKIRYSILLILLFHCIFTLKAQDGDSIVIAFYNVENLFHPDDDSVKNDDAFTPTGLNHWGWRKYSRKVNNVAKVLLALNGWSPADIVGLEEIENEAVLRKLCYDSPLRRYHYGYVHYESPDVRGVDVALLYRTDRIRILRSRAIPIVFPFDSTCRNRDLLYVVAAVPNGDSLHIVVNHWTSRYGGFAATIPKRNHYATVLRELCDSLLQENRDAYIVAGGDFNDYPTDESVTDVLQAGEWEEKCTGAGRAGPPSQLYDLMFRFGHLANVGTHKHEDFWGCLDHIIVSEALLKPTGSVRIADQQAHIFSDRFLFVPDEKYGGVKPFRTFVGPRYIGGFADHLPVYISLFITSAHNSGN